MFLVRVEREPNVEEESRELHVETHCDGNETRNGFRLGWIEVKTIVQKLVYYIGDRLYGKTKRSGPETEPWGKPIHIVVQGEDDESKDVRFEK